MDRNKDVKRQTERDKNEENQRLLIRKTERKRVIKKEKHKRMCIREYKQIKDVIINEKNKSRKTERQKDRKS